MWGYTAKAAMWANRYKGIHMPLSRPCSPEGTQPHHQALLTADNGRGFLASTLSLLQTGINCLEFSFFFFSVIFVYSWWHCNMCFACYLLWITSPPFHFISGNHEFSRSNLTLGLFLLAFSSCFSVGLSVSSEFSRKDPFLLLTVTIENGFSSSFISAILSTMFFFPSPAMCLGILFRSLCSYNGHAGQWYFYLL